MPYDIDKIISICQRFRNALENAKNPPSYMSQFPKAWCGVTARALGGYLLSQGFESVQYVLGYRGAISHAWLELGDIIIDITADQFDDCSERIFVAKESEFHNRFVIDSRHEIVPEFFNEYPENWIIRTVLNYEE